MASSSTLAIRPLATALADSFEALRCLSPQTSIPVLALDDTSPWFVCEGDGALGFSPSVMRAGRMLLALKAQLDQALAAMAVHRARVANSRTTICSLPPELLGMVFDYVRLSTPYAFYDEDFAPSMDTVFLPAHVCHQWRTICLGMSSHWTWLTVSGEHQSDMLESLLPLSRQRSVTLSVRGLRHSDAGCIRLPKRGPERIVEIRPESHEELQAFDVPRGANFGRLHTIHAGGNRSSSGNWTPLAIGHGSGLVPLLGVERLAIRGPANLKYCRKLQSLTFGCLFAKECMYMIHSLPENCPLQHLEISHISSSDDSAQARHETELTRPLDRLRTLTLRSGLPLSLARYFRGCFAPNLENLVLSGTRFERTDADLAFPPLMSTGRMRVLETDNSPSESAAVLALISPSSSHDTNSEDILLPHLSHLLVNNLSARPGAPGDIEKLNDQLVLLLDRRHECGLPDLPELTVDPAIIRARDNGELIRQKVGKLIMGPDSSTYWTDGRARAANRRRVVLIQTNGEQTEHFL